MKLKEIKHVQIFKFTNDKGKQVNIYVEPTGNGKGRLIICNNFKIYQRFFDGCNPHIYAFLSKQPTDAICACFTDEDEDFAYLQKILTDVWPQFVQHIKEMTDNVEFP